jgi:hypothetical protein
MGSLELERTLPVFAEKLLQTLPEAVEGFIARVHQVRIR